MIRSSFIKIHLENISLEALKSMCLMNYKHQTASLIFFIQTKVTREVILIIWELLQAAGLKDLLMGKKISFNNTTTISS